MCKVKKLGDYITMHSGKGFKASEYSESGVRLIKINNVGVNGIKWDDIEYLPLEYLETYPKLKLVKGDLLLALNRPILNGELKVGLLSGKDSPSILYQRVGKIIIGDTQKLNQQFLFWFFKSKFFINELTIRLDGADQPFITNKKLFDIEFNFCPPLPEQQRIVTKLDGLFAKIDKAIGLLEDNIKNTQALMGSVLDEIYSDGDTMLKEVCTLGPKKSEVKDIDDDLEVSFLPMKDLNEHNINFLPNETKKISEVYKGYTYFTDGDIIVAKVTPCFENGKAGIAKDLTNGIGFGSSEYHVLRPNDKVLPEWIYFSLITEQIKVTGRENMTGAGGLKRIPRKFLEEWKIPFPKISVQKKQIEKLKKLQEENKNLENSISKKINHLKALKSSFLDQAFKGQL